MQIKEILYIHGFNSSGNTGKFLKMHFGKRGIIVHNPTFSPNWKIAKQEIEKYLTENPNIDLIIGSSLGGFMTLNTPGYKRIVINPCMHPEIELPKLSYLGEIVAKTYEPDYSNVTSFDKDNTYAIFGLKDEILNYKDEFSKNYDYNKMYFIRDGKHSLTNEQLINVLSLILNL